MEIQKPKIEFDCEEVKTQLNRLFNALPATDKISLWLDVHEGKLSFTTCITPEGRWQNDTLFGYGENPTEAVTQAIAKRKDVVSLATRKRMEVAKLKKEIEALEKEFPAVVAPEQTPVVS